MNRYWHTHIHPGANAIAAMLANPAAAGLQNPPIPSRGFRVDQYGVDTSCQGQGCTASTAQKAAFIAALDTLDVALFLSNISFGGIFLSADHKQALVAFWSAKGLISLHHSIDGFGEWPQWDSLNAARFQNHPTSERHATLHLDALAPSASLLPYRILNQGLPDTVRFSEEWLSFTRNADGIRDLGAQTTVRIDENSYEGGMGGARAMGDHPMSWFKVLPGGGRFFYTALGHRTSTFDSVYFFRRQLYNAILWASKDTTGNGAVSVRERPAPRTPGAYQVALSGSALTVSLLTEGRHTVRIQDLAGRTEAVRYGTGKTSYGFGNLRAGSVYAVSVSTPAGASTRLVTPAR